MSEKQTTTGGGGGADDNPEHALHSEHSSNPWPRRIPDYDYSSRKQSISPWYWSVLFHNNVDEIRRSTAKKEGYGSIAVPPSTERPRKKWQLIRERIRSPDFLLSHSTFDGENGKETLHWSDLAKDSYEFRLQECFAIFVALLAVGVVGYSFLFERWSIIDSLYFTVVMLTTTGYGDITPTTPGGKIFASLFALAGIVLLGLVLGVVGSNLVEAEVAYSQKMQSTSSSALERAFGKRTSRHLNGTEYIECDSETTAESEMQRSPSPLTDSDRVCSSVNDQEMHERHCRMSTHGRFEETSCFSVILGHLSSFAPLLLGGLIMALMDHWNWYDTIYYCVVTATTIGFGDITPKTESDKAVAIVFIPIAVASMGYILGNVATHIVEKRRDEFTKRLWSAEMTMEDIEALDEDHEGGVSEVEYIKFMLVAMRKIDGELFDDLRYRFHQLDPTGDGKITQKDLVLMAKRKREKVRNKLMLREYKASTDPHFTGIIFEPDMLVLTTPLDESILFILQPKQIVEILNAT
ncbi:hypothetical protein ACHAXA_011388 [Cyclostephanos tholiformis]|uniref:EF-hand domain-containing protein n=1 Tax=Cyclostephanos tholiformis TaxID=382380 RepID=A0ABD3REK2_9STRA